MELLCRTSGMMSHKGVEYQQQKRFAVRERPSNLIWRQRSIGRCYAVLLRSYLKVFRVSHLRHGRMCSGTVLDDGDGGGGRKVHSHAEAAVLRVDGRKGEVAHAGRAGAWAGGPRRAPHYAVLQRHAPAALLLRGTPPVSALLHVPHSASGHGTEPSLHRIWKLHSSQQTQVHGKL